jgi:hypothetical protein
MQTRQFVPIVLSVAVFVLLAGCGGNQPHELERGGLNAEDLMQGLLDRTMVTLGSVTSQDSAEEALPVLEEINKEFEDLIDTKGDLSEQGQAGLSDQAAKAMPGLKDITQRINMQSYGDILRPVMYEMISNLTKLL